MMWAVRDGDGWRRVGPRQFEVGGSVYPGRVLAEWDAERLAGIGVHPVTEATPPEGQQAAGPSLLRDVDGAPVWGPAAWEPRPDPGPPLLPGWMWRALVKTTPGLEKAVGDALDVMSDKLIADGKPVHATLLRERVMGAGSYHWADFVELASEGT
jgi:hypothetical protein